MTLVAIGPYVEKMLPPALQITFTDSVGTAINVSGMSVRFEYWPVNGTATDAVERTGAVVTGASGIVKYAWVETDMVAGSYRGRMWAYDADEQYASDLYCWVVEDDAATPAAL